MGFKAVRAMYDDSEFRTAESNSVERTPGNFFIAILAIYCLNVEFSVFSKADNWDGQMIHIIS